MMLTENNLQTGKHSAVICTWQRLWVSAETVSIMDRCFWVWLSMCSLTPRCHWRSRSTRPAGTHERQRGPACCRCTLKARIMNQFGTRDRAVEVRAVTVHLPQGLLALIGCQTQRGGERGGGRGQEVCLSRNLILYWAATTADGTIKLNQIRLISWWCLQTKNGKKIFKSDLLIPSSRLRAGVSRSFVEEWRSA